MNRLFLVFMFFFILLAGVPAQELREPKLEQRYSAFNAVQLANSDAEAVAALNDPTVNVHYVRYLSLHNHSSETRKELKDVIDFVLNSLNPTYRRVIRTAPVPANTDAPVVLRINLNDYGIPISAWDSLAERGSGATPLHDPYFHTTLTADNILIQDAWEPVIGITYTNITATDRGEIRVTADGISKVFFDGQEPVFTPEGAVRKYITPQLKANEPLSYEIRLVGICEGHKYDVKTKVICKAKQCANINLVPPKARPIADKRSKALASAPWLSLEQDPAARGTTITNLIQRTNTNSPILRADWFVTYATIAPAYYELIGLSLKDNPNKEEAKARPKVFLEKDFEKLMNVDQKSAAVDIVAGITDTRIVTLHNRVLHRFNTVTGITGGYYWRSKDTDRGIDDQDYLSQITNFANPNFVATEVIASGRNGLNFYFVADNKGTGLNLAAASVAQHSDAMPCRYQDKQVWAARNCMLCHSSGMIPIKDRVRAIARDKIALFIADKTKDQELARKLDEAFSPDPQSVIDIDNAKFIASVRAASGRNGPQIAKLQESFIWNYWDKPVTLERMALEVGIETEQLRNMLKEGINLDYSLVAILQEPEEPVSILTWERKGFAALSQYVATYQPRKK